MSMEDRSNSLTHKELKLSLYTDVLVLKRKDISIHRADKYPLHRANFGQKYIALIVANS